MFTCVTSNIGLCASFADQGDKTKVMHLRRTLSADMSSKSWCAETAGLSPIVPDVDADHGRRLLDKDDQLNRPSQIDIWTSILSQKNDSHSAVPPPYVHPLVKRSASLSKKSLEICTESLGSETGSDIFSSYPTSEINSNEDVKIETEKISQPLMVDENLPQIIDAAEEVHVVKYNFAYHNKKSSGPRSFPPPLPSLAPRDGASLHMHSRRENGRLVLAAVSIPTQNNFHARRQDGRLLLTFVNENKLDLTKATGNNGVMDKAEEDHRVVFNEMAFGNFDNKEETINKDGAVSDEPGDDELEEVNTKKDMTVETPNKVAAGGVIHVHRAAFFVNKAIRLTSRNTSIWTNKFNKVVKVELRAEEEATDHQLDSKLVARSQPRRTSLISSTPPSMTSTLTSAASTFNAYEYSWRRKPTTQIFKTSPNEYTLPSSPPISSKNHNMFILTKAGKHQNEEDKMTTNFLLLKGKRDEGEFIVPYFKGCKDQKRSLLYREPYCIATS